MSLALPAKRHFENVVLKIQFPDQDSQFEAAALTAWNGNGALRLLAHDDEKSALLLERCLPGSHLSDCPDADPIGVVTDILPKLWQPVDTPFNSLTNQAKIWARDIPLAWNEAGQPCERYLVDAALDFIDILSADQPECVLLHQDLHGHNIISAERDSWLAIDPKPLIGEKAFSLAPIVRSSEFGQTRQTTLRRLDRLSADLGVDRERARGWTVAQSMAWSFGSVRGRLHHQSVRWLLDRTN